MNLPNLPSDPPKEPALTIGAGMSSIVGAVAIVQYVFPDLLSERQLGLIFIVSALVLPMIQAWLTREKVFSPATVKELIDEGIKNANELTQNQLVQKPKPILREFDKPKLKSPDESEFFKPGS